VSGVLTLLLLGCGVPDGYAAESDTKSQVPFDVPAGNILDTLELFKQQAQAARKFRFNFCSGPQPCSSHDISTGSCVPQCPGPDDKSKIVVRGCSLPCSALDSINTREVHGQFEPYDALVQMLEGTGATFAAVMTPISRDVPTDIVLLDERRHFDIPSGLSSDTLWEFTKQSGIRTLMRTKLSDRTKTAAVRGYLTPPEAINKMLTGSGLAVTLVRNQEFGYGYYVQEDPAQVVVRASRPAKDMQSLVEPQIQTVGQSELKQAPFATVQDALRSLPIISTTDVRGNINVETNLDVVNPSYATGVNIHGLGLGATLLLVNGQRQPFSGWEGRWLDVSTIPWAAVDHIDVLADGASATYGSGAIGGVVNVVMRQDTAGAETRLRHADARGGANERVVSQLLAHKWSDGSLLFAYQFSERDSLPKSAREYAASTDKRPLGGSDFRSTASNPGTILDPVSLLPIYAIPNGQNGTALRVEDLIPGANLFNWQEGSDLLPNRRSHSAYLSWSQKLAERWALDGNIRAHWRDLTVSDFAFSRRLVVPSSNAFFVSSYPGPFVLVDYNFLRDLGTVDREAHTGFANGTLVLSGTLSDDWRATVTTTYGQERLSTLDRNLIDDLSLQSALADSNPSTAFNPFGSGSNTNPATLDRIRDERHRQSASTLAELAARLEGRLGTWRYGDLRLSVGVASQLESLGRKYSDRLTSLTDSSERTSRAVFADFTAPLGKRLDVSVAGRVEDLGQAGDVTAPKVALRWSPWEAVRLRATWGRSYKAPDLIDIDEKARSSSALVPIPDPRAPNGTSLVLFRAGSKSDLAAEIARTWTAGVDITPAAREGISASLTYFNVDYRGRIDQPGGQPIINILLQEREWAEVIFRSPDRSAIDAICNGGSFFGPVDACLASTPAAIIDLRMRNIAATTASGIDLSVGQTLQTHWGDFKWSTVGTYLFSFTQANSRLAAAPDILATQGNPPRLRARVDLGWYQTHANQEGFAVESSLNYMSVFRDQNYQNLMIGFRDQSNGESRTVRPATTLDLQVSYRTQRNGGSWLDGIESALGVSNVFNADPPFLNSSAGYDTANADPIGRVVTLSLQKNF
jgi:iron complex outermembrane recepter protein